MSAVSLRGIFLDLVCSFLQCCLVFLPIRDGYPVSSTDHPLCSRGYLSILSSLVLLGIPLTQKYHLVFCLLELQDGVKMQMFNLAINLQQKIPTSQVKWDMVWSQLGAGTYIRMIMHNTNDTEFNLFSYLLLDPRQDVSSSQAHWLHS